MEFKFNGIECDHTYVTYGEPYHYAINLIATVTKAGEQFNPIRLGDGFVVTLSLDSDEDYAFDVTMHGEEHEDWAASQKDGVVKIWIGLGNNFCINLEIHD